MNEGDKRMRSRKNKEFSTLIYLFLGSSPIKFRLQIKAHLPPRKITWGRYPGKLQ
jgi:hypothetical protein